MNDLIVVETLKPLEVFSNNGLDPIIEKIELEARSVVLDISTEKGRKEIASLAHKIARSKTTLDNMGKELVADWKTQAKKVDQERARAWDRLEALQKEVRAPLTEWENKEKERIETHEAALVAIPEHPGYGQHETAAQLSDRLNHLENYPARDWQEFSARATKAISDEIERTKLLLAAAQKREAEAAELERLRREEAVRKQKEREEQIAAEAAAKATAQAEEKAKREADAAERERQRILREKEQSDERARKAEQAAQDAAKAERERIASEQKAEADAAAKREADKKHRAKINKDALYAINEIIEAFSKTGNNPAQAIVEAIARGKIPHVKITY